MAGERPGHSLQATALVNEAYLRLINTRKWIGRTVRIFWRWRLVSCVASSWTRRDPKRNQKRGGVKITLDEELLVTGDRPPDLLALDDALQALEKIDARRSQVIELRFFGGLTVDETAIVLKVAPDTVMRDSRLAKAWLARELSGGTRHDA